MASKRPGLRENLLNPNYESDLNQFYELLRELEEGLGGKRRLADCHGRMAWPRRGVYFFFEPGEYRSRLTGRQRVVRVGTHGLKTGARTTLWNRLYTHRGARDGSGNHRGSIFRLLVGAALLNKHKAVEDFPTWGRGSSAPKTVRAAEHDLELQVSEYLGKMTLLWVAIDDQPGPFSHRAAIERNTIALLSVFQHPLDPPSSDWLGHYSDRDAVRQSGLWNVNHTLDAYEPGFLYLFTRYVCKSLCVKAHT